MWHAVPIRQLADPVELNPCLALFYVFNVGIAVGIFAMDLSTYFYFILFKNRGLCNLGFLVFFPYF
jgi:hypothetical protein